jgi:hypothetical protein
MVPLRQPIATVVYDIHSKANTSESSDFTAVCESHAPASERAKSSIELEAATARCSDQVAATVFARPGDGVKVDGLAAAPHIAEQSLGVNFWPTYCKCEVSMITGVLVFDRLYARLKPTLNDRFRVRSNSYNKEPQGKPSG